MSRIATDLSTFLTPIGATSTQPSPTRLNRDRAQHLQDRLAGLGRARAQAWRSLLAVTVTDWQEVEA